MQRLCWLRQFIPALYLAPQSPLKLNPNRVSLAGICCTGRRWHSAVGATRAEVTGGTAAARRGCRCQCHLQQKRLNLHMPACVSCRERTRHGSPQERLGWAQMLRIRKLKCWEVSAEDIFPYMRPWGGAGGGSCLQQQQKAERGGEHEGEIFDSCSKITQTLLPKCLHFYVLKHSELWKS